MFHWFRKKSRKEKEIPTLREAEEKLRSSVYPMMSASSEFQEVLKEKLLAARHQKSTKPMVSFLSSLKFSSLKLPRFSLKLVPIAALAVLILLVLPLVLPYITERPDRFVLDTAYAKDLFALEAQAEDKSGVSADTKFIFKSKVPLDKDEVTSLLAFQPEVSFEIREFSKQEFEIIPQENLEPEKVYQALFEVFFKDETGNLVPKKWQWAYQVKDEFKILKTLPGNKSDLVPLNTGIEITFSHQLASAEELAPYFTITPAVAGRFEKFGRKIAFIPKGGLKPLTLYTVTIKAGLTLSGTNQILLEDHTFEFYTVSPDYGLSYFNFETPILSHFKTDEMPRFRFYSSKTRTPLPQEAVVAIHQFKNSDEFLASFSGITKDVPEWVCRRCAERKISLENLLKVNESKLIDLLSIDSYTNQSDLVFPVAFDAGFYVLSVIEGNRTFQTFFEITDLAAYLLGSETETFALVHDAKTDKPVEKASISFTHAQFKTETNSDGMIKLKIPEAEKNAPNIPSFIKIKKDNKETWLSLNIPELPGGYDGFFGDFSYGAPDFWSIISTDRPLYKPTDTVHFWGMAKRRNGNGPHMVKAAFANMEQKLSVSDFGTFHGTFELRKAKIGYHAIEIRDEEDNLISRASFTVETFAKPAYEILLRPRKEILYRGETVEFDVETKFFDGTPAPRVELKYDQWGLGKGEAAMKELKTDDTGKTLIRIPTERDKGLPVYGSGHEHLQVVIRPKQSEFGDIEANSSVTLLSSDIEISVDYSSKDKKLSGVVKELSPALYNIPREKRPVVKNHPLTFTLDAVYHDKIETGEDYDPIEKVVRKRYRYQQRFEKVEEGAITTDERGEFTINAPLSENQEYRVTMKGNDRRGYAVATQHYFTVGISEYRQSRSYSRGLWLKKLDKPESGDESKFDLGEKAKVQVMQGDEPSTEGQNYLFFEAKKGIQKIVWQTSPIYEFKFEERHIPNVYIGVVFFEKGKYEATDLLFRRSGTVLTFDETKRKLSIAIEMPKKTFRPGETVEVKFKTTDPRGKPKRAELNVKLIDEALYAIADEYVGDNPLRNLYRYLGDGITRSFASTDNTPDYYGGDLGGGGGDASVRFNFKDTAFFGTVTTNSSGEGSLPIKLPDNITRFRLTALGVTEDLYAGSAIHSVPISLPFFVDVTLNEAYTVYDSPQPRLRVFGDSVKGNEEVRYTVSSQTLGMPETTFSSKASDPVFVPLTKLALGNHSFTVTAKMGEYSDAVKQEFRVVESFMKIPSLTLRMLASGASLADIDGDRAELRFSLFPYGEYYELLMKHLYNYSSRLDAALAKAAAQKLIEQYFQKQTKNEEIDFDIYQQDDGGIGLFRYDDSDIELSAKAAFFAKDLFRIDTLAAYFDRFFNISEDRQKTEKISRRELVYAFLGKAALGKAILNEARLFAEVNRTNLTPEEKLVMAATFAALGDHTLANELFEEVTVGNTRDEHLEITALALITASYLNHETSLPLLHTLDANRPGTTLLPLEEVIALQALLKQTPAVQKGSFRYTLNGKTEKITLRNSDSFGLSLDDKELASIIFSDIDGPVGISIESEIPYGKTVAGTNPDISLRRFYRVDGKQTNTFKENEYVRVVLEPGAKVALQGGMEVVDVLPAGLLPLTGRFYGYNHGEVRPSRVEGQRVYFHVGKIDEPFAYYARVVSKGTYIADPARIQGIKNRGLFNVSEREEVTIE